MANETPVYVCEERTLNGKHGVLTCTLRVGTQAGRHVHEPAKMILKGTYLRERSRLHKFLDVFGFLGGALMILAIAWILWPQNTPNYIHVDASVAPAEIVTGAASTLTFRYENTSKSPLTDARVHFAYPAHFVVGDITTDQPEQTVTGNSIYLGEIPPGGYGFVHLAGTMFGDVGGEQIFTTEFAYQYGDKQTVDTKTIEHKFSPTRSSLALELHLPEHLVRGQTINGSITYANNGTITFPDLHIIPSWPDGFKLKTSSVSSKDGTWDVKGIEPGETGEVTFSGTFGKSEDAAFSFAPSFIFSDASYKQETLAATMTLLPSPITINLNTDADVLTPGGKLAATIILENQSDYSVHDVTVSIQGDSNVFSSSSAKTTITETIAPHTTQTVNLSLPVRSSLAKSSATTHPTGSVQAFVDFSFDAGGDTIASNAESDAITLPMTTPVSLSAFARYYAPSGDQLGRGPLPPIVGEGTSYWIFWNLTGTVNEITNAHIEAALPTNVTLTGRSSVSTGSALTLEDGSVVWNVGSLPATLSTGQVVGAAFEVKLTPTADQVGTMPILLNTTRLTATDGFTKALVGGSAKAVTTQTWNDATALPFATVE